MKQYYAIVYLVRHGETENNKKNIIGGNTRLTIEGRQQARELGRKLSQTRFDLAISSNLTRAIQTAEILAKQLRIKRVIQYERFRERDYGKYEGAPISKYQEDMKHIFDKIKKIPDEEILKFRRYRGFETDEELGLRVTSALQQISRENKSKTILVVSHGILMRVLLIYVGHASYKSLSPWAINNTAYIKIKCSHNGLRILNTDGIDYR